MDDATLPLAIGLYHTDPGVARVQYGPIEYFDVRSCTDFARLLVLKAEASNMKFDLSRWKVDYPSCAICLDQIAEADKMASVRRPIGCECKYVVCTMCYPKLTKTSCGDRCIMCRRVIEHPLQDSWRRLASHTTPTGARGDAHRDQDVGPRLLVCPVLWEMVYWTVPLFISSTATLSGAAIVTRLESSVEMCSTNTLLCSCVYATLFVWLLVLWVCASLMCYMMGATLAWRRARFEWLHVVYGFGEL